MQLEDLGFCAQGEVVRFIRENSFTLDGTLPLNTSGGQLSVGQAGAAGGYLGLVEALRQLTGTALGAAGRQCPARARERLRHDQLRPGPLQRRGGARPECAVTATQEPGAAHRRLPPARARGARADGGRRRGPLRAAGVRGVRRGAVPAARGLPQVPVRCAAVARAVRRAANSSRTRCSSTATTPSSASGCRGGSAWCSSTVGPTVVVHLHGAAGAPPARVRVGARLDRAGMAVLIGFPPEDVPNMADDRQLREMTCDPKFQKGARHRRQDRRGPGAGTRARRRGRGARLGRARRAAGRSSPHWRSWRSCRR